jgi:hypothetical protein
MRPVGALRADIHGQAIALVAALPDPRMALAALAERGLAVLVGTAAHRTWALLIGVPDSRSAVNSKQVRSPFTTFPGRTVPAIRRSPAGAGWNSYAPMSDPSPPSGLGTPATSTGRLEPRWSVVRPPLTPWSSAGLERGIAIVCVGPPLSASGFSCGSVLDRSPAALS